MFSVWRLLSCKHVCLSDPVSSVVQKIIYIGITEEGGNCSKEGWQQGDFLNRLGHRRKRVEVHPSTVKCLSWLEDGYEKLFSQAGS